MADNAFARDRDAALAEAAAVKAAEAAKTAAMATMNRTVAMGDPSLANARDQAMAIARAARDKQARAAADEAPFPPATHDLPEATMIVVDEGRATAPMADPSVGGETMMLKPQRAGPAAFNTGPPPPMGESGGYPTGQTGPHLSSAAYGASPAAIPQPAGSGPAAPAVPVFSPIMGVHAVDAPPPGGPTLGQQGARLSSASAPPSMIDDAPPSSSAGPGSFSRIFLGSLEKYRGKVEVAGSATQEAAASIAQHEAPAEKRATAATVRLRSPLAFVETAILSLLIPAIGYLAHKQDPFFLSAGFSWIVFAPLLVGLRHGFAPAMTSAVILNALIAAAWRTKFVPMDGLPGDTMIGLTALAMLTGQFSDVWKRETVRLDGGLNVLKRQLGELMRSHFLLELSHDRLQVRMGRGAPNLRDALLAVKRFAEVRSGSSLAEMSESLNDIFATYTMVEVASIHRVTDTGQFEQEPACVIGRPKPVPASDPQLNEVLRTKRLTYLPTDGSQEGSQSRTALLAVVPFADAWGKLHAVMCIESIPLLGFERRNLEALATLGGHFADVMATGGKGSDLAKGQRKEFEIRLRRALKDLQEQDVPSTIFGLTIRKGSAVSDAVDSVLGGTLRELDFPLVLRDPAGNYTIFILLPLTDTIGARALGSRIERIVRRELNMPLARSGAFHFFQVLRHDDSVAGVLKTVESKAKLDEGAVEHTIVS